MAEIIDRIDAALANQCPCGADPRPGSAWCSDDCNPTGGEKITRDAMRWRPGDTPDPDDPWADVMPPSTACSCCGEGWWSTDPELRCLTPAETQYFTGTGAVVRIEKVFDRAADDQRATQLARTGRTDPRLNGTVFTPDC